MVAHISTFQVAGMLITLSPPLFQASFRATHVVQRPAWDPILAERPTCGPSPLPRQPTYRWTHFDQYPNCGSTHVDQYPTNDSTHVDQYPTYGSAHVDQRPTCGPASTIACQLAVPALGPKFQVLFWRHRYNWYVSPTVSRDCSSQVSIFQLALYFSSATSFGASPLRSASTSVSEAGSLRDDVISVPGLLLKTSSGTFSVIVPPVVSVRSSSSLPPFLTA